MRLLVFGKLCSLLLVASLFLVSRGIAADAVAPNPPAPRLYLVGVGPGDPDLVTIRALNVMKKADLLFGSSRVKEKFPAELEGKEIIDGYWRLFPYYGQDPAKLQGEERREAEELAVKRSEFIAKVRDAVGQGQTVAIVDSGDPLIYGPWAWCLEEFEDLRPVVVPGVSCFNAANAALGRGVTNGEHTKSVILTAADWPGKTDTIDKLSAHHSTMALFTMRTDFEEFIKKLSVKLHRARKSGCSSRRCIHSRVPGIDSASSGAMPSASSRSGCPRSANDPVGRSMTRNA